MERLQGTDAERLVQTLDQEIRSRGRGSIRAVDRAIGYDVGWWQNRAKSKNITVHQLLKVLDHLGLNPAGFMRRALGSDDGILVGGLELNRPRGEPPIIVVKAWDRVRSGVEGTGVGTAFLDTLDKQRYQEPEEVVRLARWAVDHVELELLPRLLGVVGSAWRLMILLDEAECAIYAGIEIAQERGDRAAVGNLLQRLSYVVADRGDRSEALRFAERAAVVFLRLGDWVGLAKATVEQGIWLYYLGEFIESIEAHNVALDQLPDSCAMYRCTAFQYLGLNHRQIGELQEAIRYLNEAETAAIVGGTEEWPKCKLDWLRALILVDLGELEKAAILLFAVVETYRELHPGEAALAICDLVKVHLLRKNPESAYLAARSMLALLEPLRHNQIISAAIGDLVRCGQAGLTLALVKRVKARIKGERKRQQVWQALESRS